MTKETITSVYHIKEIGPKQSIASTGPRTAEGLLLGVESRARKQCEDLPLNHFAFYFQDTGSESRSAVLITNVDSDDSREGFDDTIDHVLTSTLERYETGLSKKRVRVSRTTSTEPKPSDYQLMQMCGLLG